MDFKTFIFYVIVIAVTIFGLGFINALSKYLVSKIETIIGNIEQDSYTYSKELLCWIRDVIIRDVVISLNETVVKEVKNASEDGKITAEEGKVILETAVTKIKNQLSESMKKKLSLIVKDIDSWIRSVVETVLKEEKISENSVESDSGLYPSSITSTTYFAKNKSPNLECDYDYPEDRY